jgi:hypothetical protein
MSTHHPNSSSSTGLVRALELIALAGGGVIAPGRTPPQVGRLLNGSSYNEGEVERANAMRRFVRRCECGGAIYEDPGYCVRCVWDSEFSAGESRETSPQPVQRTGPYRGCRPSGPRADARREDMS